MQAYQSVPCLYCGASWNPPGAQACSKCHNPLPAPQPVYPVGAAAAAPASAVIAKGGAPGFYRSPLRTFVFALVGSDAYLLWWSFQLLRFAQREQMAKSGSPWWVLFPGMNFLFVGRAFKAISEGEKTVLGRSSLPLPLVSLGYMGAIVLGRLTTRVTGMTGFVIDLTIVVVLAGVLTLVQRSANRYQAAAHAELGPAPTGMAGHYTWGEIVALILGCLLTLLLFVGDLAPN